MALFDLGKAGAGAISGATDITGIVEFVPTEYQGAASFILTTSFSALIQSDFITGFLKEAFNVTVDATAVASVNPMSIALNQINAKIDDLQEDMKSLLQADMKTAKDRFSKAMNYIQNEETQQQAYNELESVLNAATKAFATVKSFRNQVLCKQLAISTRAAFFYDVSNLDWLKLII